MKILSALLAPAALVIGCFGCSASAQPKPEVTLTDPGTIDPAPIEETIKSGLLARILEDARRTQADIDAWVKAGTITPVNTVTARLCPTALQTTIPDFQADLAALVAGIKNLKPSTGEGDEGVYLLQLKTRIAFGPKARGTVSLPDLVDRSRDRLRLIRTSCEALEVKLVGDLVRVMARAGIVAGGVSSGAGPALGVLRFLVR